MIVCPTDPNSYANSHQVITKHIHLDWNVDFVSKCIKGWADYSFKAVTETNQIVLDIKGISIKAISLEAESLKVF